MLPDTSAIMTPLVSIILPAYNAERTVADAITSILLQTYSNWELLLIDDGSCDNTLKIVKQFDDPRIKIYADGSNKRLSVRLNEGIDRAEGKYLARMDADDMCFPDRLTRQVEYLESHPEIDLLGTTAVLFNDSGNIIGRYPFRQTHEEICKRPWNGFYLAHPTWMGKSEWFRKYRYRIPEVERAEDQDLLLRSYPSSRFACLPDMLFAYRMREQISLPINQVSRKNLLRALILEFYRRGEWRYLALAALAFVGKSANDTWCALARRNAKFSTAGLDGYETSWDLLKSRISLYKATL